MPEAVNRSGRSEVLSSTNHGRSRPGESPVKSKLESSSSKRKLVLAEGSERRVSTEGVGDNVEDGLVDLRSRADGMRGSGRSPRHFSVVEGKEAMVLPWLKLLRLLRGRLEI